MRRVHYVLSTHWDREWYQGFQDFRYRLVQMVDRVMAGWERETLGGAFQTDGQAILLEDYLEVRPEQAEQVHQRVADGHFKVGPWYVLPDEFLVSGESLIRNLRLGRQLARGWGGVPSDAGFLCDMFGHNSQMPQIFAQIGVRGAFVWRGTNLLNNRLFLWRGADGTELPTYRFGRIGYCTFAIQVRQSDLTQPLLKAEDLNARLDAFLKEEDEQVPVGPMLAFDGCDHAEWDSAAYRVLAERMEHPDGKPVGKYEIVHTTLDDYLTELLAVRGEIRQVLEGELREPGLFPGEKEAQWLIPGVDSSRVRLKQANAACETTLCHWAEPLSAFAHAAAGLPYPTGYLEVAWRWLLQNHPHDSICGCSIDAVHQDMRYRFHQSQSIADRLTTEAARAIALGAVTPSAAATENQQAEGQPQARVVVFNPLPRAVDEIVTLEVDVPTDWPGWSEMTSFETRAGLQILDADGQAVMYQRIGQKLNQPRFRVYDTTFPRGYNVHALKIALPVQLPPLGYTTLSLRPGQLGMPTLPASGANLVTGVRSMANDYLSVTFETNGAITILDRRSGNSYRGLLTFEDCADIGDGWNHGPATNDEVFLSIASAAEVSLVSHGPLMASFRVRVCMRVPAGFDAQTGGRSTQRADLVIDSLVSLRAGAECVSVQTTVYNTIRDHRLRVLFPSQAVRARSYLADTPFDVVERSIALRADNAQYREPEVETKPQQNWTAVFDGQRGLAIIAPGLYESAVLDTAERTVALTLLRATQRTVNTAGEPEGQVQGELHYAFEIMPLNGAPDRVRLFDRATLLAAGLRTVQLLPEDLSNLAQSAARSEREVMPLPPTAGFLSLSGAVTLTSVRRTAAGLELRIFNPTSQPTQAHLSLYELRITAARRPASRHAQWVNLESTPLSKPFALDGNTLTFEVHPKQIRTLCLIE